MSIFLHLLSDASYKSWTLFNSRKIFTIHVVTNSWITTKSWTSIITKDEPRYHQYEPESKRQSTEEQIFFFFFTCAECPLLVLTMWKIEVLSNGIVVPLVSVAEINRRYYFQSVPSGRLKWTICKCKQKMPKSVSVGQYQVTLIYLNKP